MRTPSQLEINRKFERNFPDIANDEREYEQDLLADWRFVADGRRSIREQQLSDNLTTSMKEKLEQNKKHTLEELLGIRYIYKFDDKEGKEFYFMMEKDKDWNVIVDKENKRIKFIDEASWESIFEDYVENAKEEN